MACSNSYIASIKPCYSQMTFLEGTSFKCNFHSYWSMIAIPSPYTSTFNQVVLTPPFVHVTNLACISLITKCGISYVRHLCYLATPTCMLHFSHVWLLEIGLCNIELVFFSFQISLLFSLGIL